MDGKDITHLKPAESFLLHLLNVDHLKLRLEVMLFVVDFPVEERSIRKNCQDIINACKVIQSSEGYRRFLQIVLAVGNKMNEVRSPSFLYALIGSSSHAPKLHRVRLDALIFGSATTLLLRNQLQKQQSRFEMTGRKGSALNTSKIAQSSGFIGRQAFVSLFVTAVDH